MYRVVTLTSHSYVGFSRKLAFQFARACRGEGLPFLMSKRGSAGWREIAEADFA